MENANSYEYLEKIKVAVIENLKKTAPVPSVQMQDIPRATMGMTDEEEAELDDLDDDENKDVRMTQRMWEKKVSRQDEFDESDDEDIAQANGVHKTNGRGRRSILDYRNPHADYDMDSGMATPVRSGDAADETMVDEPTATEAQPETDSKGASEKDAAAVDKDGDVDMAEAGEAAPEASIKKEDVDVLPSPKTENNEPATASADDSNGTKAAEADDTSKKTSSPSAAANGDKPVATEKPAEEAAEETAAESGDKMDTDAAEEGAAEDAEKS
jgi:histone deacetylase 1/2